MNISEAIYVLNSILSTIKENGTPVTINLNIVVGDNNCTIAGDCNSTSFRQSIGDNTVRLR